jgi:5'(3')-deoxyribonucleotidase
MLEKLILCPDKSLVKGDYLIDDDIKHGQLTFEGEHIRFGSSNFPDWKSVIKYLL